MGDDRYRKDLRELRAAVHVRTKEELVARLKSRGMTLNDLFQSVVDAYLKGHPALNAIVEQWVEADRRVRAKRPEDFGLTDPERKRLRDLVYDMGDGEW